MGSWGGFFVPTDFIDTPPSEQREFVRNHRILFSEEYPDGRLAMSLAELRTLAEHHQVGCHTASHHRMVADTTDKQLRREIFEARARLEAQIGKAVESFCWVGGEQDTYQTQAAQYVRQAGYRFAFLTNNAVIRRGTGWHELQRTNIEVGWSAEVVDFQMSGLLDFVYWPKRRRVARLISARTTLSALKEQGNICAIMD